MSHHYGIDSYVPLDSIYGGGRPAIKYSTIKDEASPIKEDPKVSGSKIVTYGEAPQTVVKKDDDTNLEHEFVAGTLKSTGKFYEFKTPSTYEKFIEYEYNNKKYIRIKFKNKTTPDHLLSSGHYSSIGEVFWVKVEPVEWLVDEKKDIALAKKILFAGVEFDINCEEYINFQKVYTGKYRTSIIKQFLDECFTPWVIDQKTLAKITNGNATTVKKKTNTSRKTANKKINNNSQKGVSSSLPVTSSKPSESSQEIKELYDEFIKKISEQFPDIDFDSKELSPELKSALNGYKQMYNSQHQEIEPTKPNIKNNNKPARKQNPYDFSFEQVEEEDIIEGTVRSGVPVFLHGKSSDGKSARVKQLDPDCVIIYMRNATPDSLNGKSVYNASNGEMIDVPPTWFIKIKEKCEKEPNKIHILFFDELTNALPSIQGMAFNIILDGEVNGKWKLPANARIVAAGNDLNDSLAANQMAEPLFNRFAHVYIETTVDSWLRWASTPMEKYERLDYKEDVLPAKIHPAVYAYIAYRSFTGYDVLRTKYNGEKPNADPRKWEMASKILYRTKKPDMLRALIGKELTEDFKEFAKQQVISVDDVINGRYSNSELYVMDVSKKFAIAVGLSSVDDEHFEIVREFMKKVGAEPRAAFESMWARGNNKRLERLAEIQMKESFGRGR